VVDQPTAFPNKMEKRGKEGHCLQLIIGLIGCRKKKRNRKGGQDTVNQLTTLPNKKVEEKKGRLQLAINYWTNWLQKRNRNRKWRPRCS